MVSDGHDDRDSSLSKGQLKEITDLFKEKFDELLKRIDEKFSSHQSVCQERYITKDEFFKWQVAGALSVLMSGLALGFKIWPMLH